MSYATALSPETQASLSRLEIIEQEEVLDVFDRLADDGDALPNRPLPLGFVPEFDISTRHGRKVAVAEVEYDPPRRVMTVRNLHVVGSPGDG